MRGWCAVFGEPSIGPISAIPHGVGVGVGGPRAQEGPPQLYRPLEAEPEGDQEVGIGVGVGMECVSLLSVF